MPKPSTIPTWATDGGALVLPAPTSGEAATGWVPGTPPPANFMNHMMKSYGDWLTWLNEYESTVHIWTASQTYTGGSTQVLLADGATLAINTSTLYLNASLLSGDSFSRIVMAGSNNYETLPTEDQSAIGVITNSGTGAALQVRNTGGGYGLIVEAGTGVAGNRSPLRIAPRATQPAAANMGDLYVHASDGKLYIYDGSAWVVVGSQS